MKKKGTIIFSILGVVLIAVGVALAILNTPKQSKKEAFVTALQRSVGFNADGKFELLNNSKLNEIKELNFDENIYKVTFNSEVTMDEAATQKGNYELYLGKNQIYALLNNFFNDDNKTIELLFKDSKLYFTVKELLNKYYYVDASETLNDVKIPTVDTEIMDKLFKYFTESFEEILEEEKINDTDEEITINSKSYKTKKYTYSFTGNTLYDMIDKFVKKVKNDKELMSSIETYFNDMVSEIIKGVNQSGFNSDETGLDFDTSQLENFDLNTIIDKFMEEIKSVKDMGELLNHSVYTYKDDSIKTEIEVFMPQADYSNREADSFKQSNENVQVEKQSIILYIDDVEEDGLLYGKIAVSSASVEMFDFVMKQTSKTNYELKANMFSQELLTGNMTIDGDNFTFDVKTTEISPVAVNMNLSISGNTGTIAIDSDTAKAKADFTFEKVEEMPNVDVSNSAPYTEMTDEEKELLEKSFDLSGIIPGNDDNNNRIDFNYNWNMEDDTSTQADWSINESSEDLAF